MSRRGAAPPLPLMRAAARLAFYRSDFEVFAQEQLKIATKRAALEPLRLRTFQQRLYQKIRAQEVRQGFVRQVWLKSRQIGTSTLSQGLVFWKTVLNPYVNSIVIAHDVGTSQTIFQMARRFYDHLDRSLKPMVRYSTKQELVFDNPKDQERESIPGLNSRIIVSTARNVHSGAGGTFHCVHLSEAARFPNPKEIESSTLQTVPLAPNTAVIIESTARPEGHWFRAMCDAARDGRSPYEFEFIGWDQDPTCWADLEPGERLDPDEDERALMAQYGLGAEQIKWRRRKLEELLGDIDAFNMDFPLEYEQAWITREFSVFPPQQLRVVSAGLSAPKFRGDMIPPGKAAMGLDGPLSVWEEPQDGALYDIGADVAMGVEGGDWSTAIVIKRPTGEQVAEYRARVEPGEWADILRWLGAYYHMAQIACEANGVGVYTNAELLKHYPNVFLWRKIDRIDQPLSKWGGFETTVKTKKLLIARGKDRLYRYCTTGQREQFALIRSEPLWKEMVTFVQEPGTDQYGAAPGHHDDLVMAWLIATMAAYEDPLAQFGEPPAAPSHEPHEPGCVCQGCEPSCYLSEEETAVLAGRASSWYGDIEGWN